MSWLGKLIRAKPSAKITASEHAVIVHFLYGSTDLTTLFALEDRLETAISAASAGVLDGNEVNANGADGSLYMYGPDVYSQLVFRSGGHGRLVFLHGRKCRRFFCATEDRWTMSQSVR